MNNPALHLRKQAPKGAASSAFMPYWLHALVIQPTASAWLFNLRPSVLKLSVRRFPFSTSSFET